MKPGKETIVTILLLSLVLFGTGTYLYLTQQVKANQKRLDRMARCIPTFPDGDGPYYKPDVPFREKISPDTSNGQKLIVTGILYENDCDTPVPNAVLEIWQANEVGTYILDSYRGKIRTKSNGSYVFETVMPKGYGEGTGYRPPHIHFKVFKNDQLIITSEMFFPEAHGKPGFNDAYIMTTETRNAMLYGHHDIILP